MNYNNEPEMFKKGSVLYRDVSAYHLGLGKAIDILKAGALKSESTTEESMAYSIRGDKMLSKTQEKKMQRAKILKEHVDIIQLEFWRLRPWLLPA